MNTVFMHVHMLNDGSTLRHSHPMLPAVPHTHSADALSLIGQCNLAAASVEATAQMPVAFTDTQWVRINIEPVLVAADCKVAAASLRGPPVEG